MANKTVGIFVGSLRKDSFNKKIANYLVSITPEGYTFKIIEIGQLAFYNQDFDDEGTAPENYATFREEVKALDTVLFVTPEYNRSVPAVLKNAIDVASRPYGKSVWDKKPGAVISSSIGGIGGFGANHHLRQSLVFVNVPTMAQPEMYCGNVADSFDKEGKLTNKETEKFFKGFLEAYVKWVETFVK
ncbi:NADPH-dependent FMN reductase [Sphingobacterium sp. 1.A.4]|uniref:NADPH-dependent FMN reductase n=1 Tax=Sphingobacterium sp. 1.A.4 TaxID=2044603 RepID=UPI000C0BCC21|nr:NAD(P)H-dependent oxidoreductase [Sphingobacterium sp. 1.A.4]